MSFRDWILLENKVSSQGIMKYGPGIRAAVVIDSQLAKYYLSLIPKYYYAKPQMHDTHITVVRINVETPLKMAAWEKYEGHKVSFEYSSDIKKMGSYFYLEVTSQQIGDIREELGLPRFRERYDCYHMTIGNTK